MLRMNAARRHIGPSFPKPVRNRFLWNVGARPPNYIYIFLYKISQTSHLWSQLWPPQNISCENSISLWTYKVGDEDLNIGCADLTSCKGVNGQANIPYFRQMCSSPWAPREKDPWHWWRAGKYTPDTGPFPHGEPSAHTPPYVSATQINIKISTGGSLPSHIVTFIQWQIFYISNS